MDDDCVAERAPGDDPASSGSSHFSRQQPLSLGDSSSFKDLLNADRPAVEGTGQALNRQDQAVASHLIHKFKAQNKAKK